MRESNHHSLLCLLQLQRTSDLPSASVNFLIFPSVTAKLHIRHQTFTLFYPSINKSTTVIIEIIQKRSVVMKMSLYPLYKQ